MSSWCLQPAVQTTTACLSNWGKNVICNYFWLCVWGENCKNLCDELNILYVDVWDDQQGDTDSANKTLGLVRNLYNII